MSNNSKIEWTEATWNPVRGCTKVSPGCAHCYAETFAERFRGVKGHPYEQGFDLRLVPEKLVEPMKWKTPRRVFVNSMSDLFQDGVPDDYIDQVFAVMALCDETRSNPRNHTFQVLTKRADRMCAYMSDLETPYRIHSEVVGRVITGYWPRKSGCDWDQISPWPLKNVWLGVSVESQHFANERIPLLLQTPAAVRFISAEPLLGPVDLTRVIDRTYPKPASRNALVRTPCSSQHRLDWVIVGGESGHGARPFNVAWARSMVSQCTSAGVPVFVKQLGARVIDRNDAGFTGDFDGSRTCWPEQHAIDDRIEHDLDGTRDGYQGAPVRIHLLSRKGGDADEWPEDLRVRQFPVEPQRP